jgi:hypothetical protein
MKHAVKTLILFLILSSLVACGSSNPCDHDMLDCSECRDEVHCAPTPSPTATPEPTPTPTPIPMEPVCENEECTMLSQTRSAGLGQEIDIGNPVSWTNPNNIGSSNNTYAQASFTNIGLTSQILQASQFGFTIPSNAVIVGVEVVIEFSRNDTDRLVDGSTVHVRSAAGTSLVGDIQGSSTWASGPWPTTDTSETLGSPTNLLGQAIAASVINGSGFNVRLQTASGISGAATTDARIDHVQATVYYEISGDLGQTF